MHHPSYSIELHVILNVFLFIGLVVGDMLMAIFWMIVGLYTPLSYHVLPL